MKKFVRIASTFGLVTLVTATAMWARFTPSSTARKAWKDKAVADISLRARSPNWPGDEIAGLKARIAEPGDSDDWLSPGLILMGKGDWIAYTNICQKQDRRIEDLFIGRGSDGQWYYSTFHFCKGMLVLRGEDRPEDLRSFAKGYFLRTFDGRSDESLRKTWPLRDNSSPK